MSPSRTLPSSEEQSKFLGDDLESTDKSNGNDQDELDSRGSFLKSPPKTALLQRRRVPLYCVALLFIFFLLVVIFRSWTSNSAETSSSKYPEEHEEKDYSTALGEKDHSIAQEEKDNSNPPQENDYSDAQKENDYSSAFDGLAEPVASHEEEIDESIGRSNDTLPLLEANSTFEDEAYDDEEDGKISNANRSSVKQDCLPLRCFVPKHFIRRPALLADDAKAFTLLASFPGSGNTWTRSIIEEGTRLFTGSVYPIDYLLLRDGFKGEAIDSFGSAHPTVAVVKTHYPLFSYPPSPKTRAVVQILRSPFDALLSEFHREFSEKGDTHVSVASDELLRTRFPSWFNNRIRAYVGHVGLWDGVRFWEEHAQYRRDDAGVTSFELPAQPIFKREIGSAHVNRTVPVLVLFYEDFLTNFDETVRRMFEFLERKSLGQAMPPVEDAVMCARINHEHELANKRPHDKTINPFTDPHGGFVKQSLAPKACETLKKVWFEDKWGPCMEGILMQSSRLHKDDLLPALPSNRCPKPAIP